MQLEGHPLAPAEVEVSDRQLDRFRELVRRGKGRRDFDDDCFYEVWRFVCVRAPSYACILCIWVISETCARTARMKLGFLFQGAFSGGELNGHGLYTFNDGSTYSGISISAPFP